jgi:hypothetical protein
MPETHQPEFLEEGDFVRISKGLYAGKSGTVDEVNFVRYDVAVYTVRITLPNGHPVCETGSSSDGKFKLLRKKSEIDKMLAFFDQPIVADSTPIVPAVTQETALPFMDD